MDENEFRRKRKLTPQEQINSMMGTATADSMTDLLGSNTPGRELGGSSDSTAYSDDRERRIKALERMGVNPNSTEQYNKDIQNKKIDQEDLSAEIDPEIEQYMQRERSAYTPPARPELPKETPEQRQSRIMQLLKSRGLK